MVNFSIVIELDGFTKLARFFGSNGFRLFNLVFSVLLWFWSTNGFERLTQPDSSLIPGPTGWTTGSVLFLKYCY